MIRRVPLGAALFALLLATMAAAVLTVRARTPDLILEVLEPERCFAFSPEALADPKEAQLEFFVRRSDPAAVVAIVDAEEDVVRTLDPDLALDAGEAVSYEWDGRSDAGRIAKPGRYRLSVELPESDRAMVWPARITLYSGSGPPPLRQGEGGECEETRPQPGAELDPARARSGGGAN